MKTMSIRLKSYFSGFALLMIIILMGIFLIIQVQDILRVKTSQYTIQLIDKICYDIDIRLGELDWQTGQLVYDKDVIALSQGDNSLSIIDAVQTKIRATLDSLPTFVVDGDILVLSKNMRILASTEPEWVGKYRTLGVEWSNKVIQAGGSSIRITGYSVSKGDTLRISKIMNIARAIIVDDQYRGMLILDIPTESLESVIAGVNIGTKGFISIIDADNYVIFSTNPVDIGNQFKRISSDTASDQSSFIGTIDGENMFFVKTKSSFSDITVVGALPLKEVFGPVAILTRNVSFVILVFGFVILMVALWVVFSISRPMLHLVQVMRKVEHGDLTVRVQERRTDEIGILEKGFNKMLTQVEDLIEREYLADLREREAQLNELIAIINPHFIYNTLEVINMRAYLNNDTQVVEMISGLARLLRIMTTNTSRYITIAEELNHCSTYLDLINFKDDVAISLRSNLPAEVLGAYTLRFLLQPIVENSIIHGFSGRNHGTIDIEAYQDGQAVVMTIIDDGLGIPAERLIEVQNVLEGKAVETAKPLALKNIQDRIRLVFGKTYGLSLDQVPTGGTLVRLCIPLLRSPSETTL